MLTSRIQSFSNIRESNRIRIFELFDSTEECSEGALYSWPVRGIVSVVAIMVNPALLMNPHVYLQRYQNVIQQHSRPIQKTALYCLPICRRVASSYL